MILTSLKNTKCLQIKKLYYTYMSPNKIYTLTDVTVPIVL